MGDKYDDKARELFLAHRHDGQYDGVMQFNIAQALREAAAEVYEEVIFWHKSKYCEHGRINSIYPPSNEDADLAGWHGYAASYFRTRATSLRNGQEK